jgi:hypothetical protein
LTEASAETIGEAVTRQAKPLAALAYFIQDVFGLLALDAP